MIYTITGKNSHALATFMRERIADFTQLNGDFALEKHDASDTSVDTLIQAAQSLPFLADKKMVVVRQASANTELLDRIEELVSRNEESVDVYLVDSVFDKRRTSYKQLQKLTTVKNFNPLKPPELVGWISETVHGLGGSISRANAQLLVQRVGEDQQQLDQEISKLLLYNTDITKESIGLLTDESVLSSIFTLLDAVFQGNKRKAIALYKEQRAAQVDPNYIIAMLTWQLQTVGLAVHAEPKTIDTLVDAGKTPFAARKALDISQKVTKSAFKNYVVELSDIDANIKNGVVDADAALELFLLRS